MSLVLLPRIAVRTIFARPIRPERTERREVGDEARLTHAVTKSLMGDGGVNPYSTPHDGDMAASSLSFYRP